VTTLKDVAKEVGVSVATVSYVLNGKGSVSDDVKARVQRTVKKLGYRPNRSAQAIRTGSSKSIGLILPDLTNPFFPELAQRIESAARGKGLAVMLVDCQNDTEIEKEGIDLLAQQQVDGIIWCPAGEKKHKNLTKVGCPVVLIDRALPGLDVIHSDYRKGGVLLAEYAIGLGHEHVGMLSGPQKFFSARQRREGFLAAAADHLIVDWEIEVPFTSELNDEARAKLKKNKSSLIVAGNDLIAIAVIEMLRESGKRVPEDVSVVGFDNIPWSRIISPKLTTINQPIGSLGSEAVKALVEKISDSTQPVRKIVLDVELIIRDSASPI